MTLSTEINSTEYFNQSSLPSFLGDEEFKIIANLLQARSVLKGDLIEVNNNDYILFVSNSPTHEGHLDYSFIKNTTIVTKEGILFNLNINNLRKLMNQHIFEALSFDRLFGNSLSPLFQI